MSIPNLLLGLRIVESSMALEKTKQPVREHKQRRGMSDSYHRRVQKKWSRRFGFVLKPAMFIVSPRAIGLQGADYIVCHPALMAQVRTALGEFAPKERRFG